MPIPVKNSWQPILDAAQKTPSYQKLHHFLKAEYANQEVFPPMSDLWTAFELCSFDHVKVVILGQDPYHKKGQAHGLSFSVNKGIPIPPSLQNIHKELADDLNIQPPDHGNLSGWADQGVLLLNTVLTVRQGQAHSHRGQGWEELTDQVIQSLNEKQDPVVFILWGNPAKEKIKLINTEKHFIITSVHPSPLSAYRGFFGSRPFSKANTYLHTSNQTPIDWSRFSLEQHRN